MPPKKRCPNGTRRNKKTGLCEPNKKDSIRTNNNNKNKNNNNNKNTTEDFNSIKNGLLKEIRDTLISIDTEENRIKNLLKTKEDIEILSYKTNEFDKNKKIDNVDNVDLGLYPNILDSNFNVKIANKKEFHDTRYPIGVKNVIDESIKQCNREFELAPHQAFVKNFMSSLTPYNGLLLYHGLGTGKTCSAISICEEVRTYMKLMNKDMKIYIIASPNVQKNFELQLFDERKLILENKQWSLNNCAGNDFLKEINPTNVDDFPKDKIIKSIQKLISKHYVFMGYNKFANTIHKMMDKNISIKETFSNNLIVIDEVHNIRNTKDSPSRDVSKMLIKVISKSKNLKLLFLSATPMFNHYQEILFLFNLLLLNDKRPLMEHQDIFDKYGNFKIDDDGNEIGKQMLMDKTRGYLSYIRGENLFSFPYRIYPSYFSRENSSLHISNPYPKYQLNGKEILEPLQYLDIYMNSLSEYQSNVYNAFLTKYIESSQIRVIKDGRIDNVVSNNISLENEDIISKDDNDNDNLTDDASSDFLSLKTMESFMQVMNFTYPIVDTELHSNLKDMNLNDLKECIGLDGLKSCMMFDIHETSKDSYPLYSNFVYKNECLQKYGRIFQMKHLSKYSTKLFQIMDSIQKSKGVVLIYSSYIDAGCVPIALALEEMGIYRYGNTSSLLKTNHAPERDAITMQTRNEHMKNNNKTSFIPAKYVMITGNQYLSSDNKKEIIASTNATNLYGKDVKVIIISQAGSEGIDFKFIRQVHICDSWYNLSRHEQIIGRGVRYCSHALLPFEERNVEIYMYGSKINKQFIHPNETNYYQDMECIDLYLYRLAEQKALKIGNVSRVLKRNAVDCYLNTGLNNPEIDKHVFTLKLSSGKTIEYDIRDKPNTTLCDFKDDCHYTCLPEISKDKTLMFGTDTSTLHSRFISYTTDQIIKKIKQIFRSRYVISKQDIILELQLIKQYSIYEINMALETMLVDTSEILTDMFGRVGRLQNIDTLYMFQPIEMDNAKLTYVERSKPLDFRHKEIKLNIKLQDDDNGLNLFTQKYKNEYKNIVDRIRSLNSLVNVENNKDKDKKQKRKGNQWNDIIPEVVQRIHKQTGININIYDKFIVHHFIDIMNTSEKMKWIEYLENKKEKDYDDFEKHVFSYIQNSLFIVSDDKQIKGYVILSKNKNKKIFIGLFVMRNGKLRDALPSEREVLASSLEKMKKDTLDTLDDFIGFMYPFKEENIVFKSKWIKTESGLTCIQSSKRFIIARLNHIYNTYFGISDAYNYKSTRNIPLLMMCSELELILRVVNEKEANKILFVYTELSIFTKIQDFKRIQ